jgi:hypothetical protein
MARTGEQRADSGSGLSVWTFIGLARAAGGKARLDWGSR